MAAAATVLFASQAFAVVVVTSPITYDVNLTVGDGTVTGDIVTDGNTSPSSPDITNWNLLLTEPGSSADLTGSNSYLFSDGTDLSATASQLFYNFSVAPGGLGFLSNTDPLNTWLCFQSSGQECAPLSDGAPVIAFSIAGDPAQSYSGNQVIGTAATPIPAALPLFVSGLGTLGLLGWRRKRKTAALAA